MKKKTIAAGIGLACGLACAPAFAQDSGESSATFYGIADFAMVNFSNQTTTGTGTGIRNYMLSGPLSTSRWGIRGREDLGGGTATIYNLESLADFTTGELTLGRQQNLVTDAIDKIDAFSGQSTSFNPNNAYIGDNSTAFFGPAGAGGGATMAHTNNAVK
ncbi:MAG: porin [Candidatus Protistobacter heckmanni]|nr:porin [Candidatus Protistobacter heckmanni]